MTQRSGAIARHAFTIIELLVAVSVIIALMSLLIVAVNAAMRSAQKTNTVVLMNSMKQGLVQFENDIGYFPPVLKDRGDPQTRQRDLQIPILRTNPTYDTQIKNYFSITSLAEYLLGYDTEMFDGADGLGLRHPGEDGVWSATLNRGNMQGVGQIDNRDPPIDGKIYGPYLQLSDDRMLAKVDPQGNLYYPGDAAYQTDTFPLVIVDYWGEPIRYYRKPYASEFAIRQEIRTRKTHIMNAQALEPPSLADIPCLRPIRLTPGEEVDSKVRDRIGDTTASRRLLGAQFALLSSGPDKGLDELVRFDETDEDGDEVTLENEDNIVEVGP